MQNSEAIQRMTIEWIRAQPSRGRSICGFVTHRARAADVLQLAAVGRRVSNELDKPRVCGQITAETPIIGMIIASERSRRRTFCSSIPKGGYGDLARGVPASSSADEEGKDTVMLAVDQQALILNMAAGPAVDPIRVLVSEQRQHRRPFDP